MCFENALLLIYLQYRLKQFSHKNRLLAEVQKNCKVPNKRNIVSKQILCISNVLPRNLCFSYFKLLSCGTLNACSYR